MKKIIFYTLVTCILGACDLVDVVDIKPKDVLTEESAIRNQETAESALAGIYRQLNGNTIAYHQTVLQLGIEAQPGGYTGGSTSNYYVNNVDPQDGEVLSIYTHSYDVINRTNYLIEKLPQLDDGLFEGNRKTEIMAEARFMRGLYHFYTLRLYGQFWDLTSKYGIVLKDVPARSSNPKPRSTVQQSYEFILNDIDFAIDNLPIAIPIGADNPAIYANRYAAVGMKARIKLYMGEYSEAATLAKEVVDDGPFTLENTFAEVFENGYESNEMLLASYFDNDEYNATFDTWFLYLEVSDQYKQIANNLGDTRVNYVDWTHPIYGPGNGKYRFVDLFESHTNIYMRLAEVYLIYAEALARSNGTLTDADSPHFSQVF